MRALFIVAQEGYQDQEYQTPKKLLEEAGVEVITASGKADWAYGSLGGKLKATISLKEVKVADYDAIIFIGGPGAVKYQQDSEAWRIVREAAKSGKVLAAICISPTILAYAGVLKGKRATVWNGDGKQQSVLIENGATYTGEAVTVEGKILTANGPAAALDFGKALLRLMTDNSQSGTKERKR